MFILGAPQAITLLNNLRPESLNLGREQTGTNKPSSWNTGVTQERRKKSYCFTVFLLQNPPYKIRSCQLKSSNCFICLMSSSFNTNISLHAEAWKEAQCYEVKKGKKITTEAARCASLTTERLNVGAVKLASQSGLIVLQLSKQRGGNTANSKKAFKKDNFAHCHTISTQPIFQRSHAQLKGALYLCPCHFDGADNVALPGTLAI